MSELNMSPSANFSFQSPPHTSEESPQPEETFSPPRRYYAPVLSEEVLWEIGGFKNGSKAFDSKLFFFAGILWRASFGLNRRHPDFYYVVVSPAQILSTDSRLLCEFSVSSSNTNTTDETGSHLEPHVCRSSRNYLFPCSEIKHKGFDRFIRREKVGLYLEGTNKLSLRITMSTDIGLQGELLGCTEMKSNSHEAEEEFRS
jgi:hypothetical protein